MLLQQQHSLHCHHHGGGSAQPARSSRSLLPCRGNRAQPVFFSSCSSSCSNTRSTSFSAAVEFSCSTSGRSMEARSREPQLLQPQPWRHHHRQQPPACSINAEMQQQEQQQQQQQEQQQQGAVSSSNRHPASHSFLMSLLLSASATLLLPSSASASGGGALTGGALDLFRQFLGGVEGLGPWGPVVFLLVVMVCEMVPLFPTQPLSLASGLLFGAVNGAILMLLGVTLAAVNAFLIARGVGRPLAQKVIEWEMKSHGGSEGAGAEEGSGGGGGMASKMSDVQRTIERGGLWQQIGAITLLRLTPVVPFSASNYLLGLTPVQLPAFLGGTLGGMAVWSVLYASLGGASRKLLDNGADIGSLLTDLGGKASAMSANVAGYSLIAIGGVAAVYFIRVLIQRNSPSSNPSMPLAGAEGSGPSTTNSWQQQPQPPSTQQSQPSGSPDAVANGDAAAVTGIRGASHVQQSRGLPQTNETLQNK